MLLLLLLLVAASSPAPAAGDDGAVPVVNPFSYFCNSTGGKRTYMPNSTFEANLATLSAVLRKNASVSGFSAGAFGAGSDTAYGLVMCRGDFTGTGCSTCLETAFEDVAAFCGNSKDVTIYHDQCQLRFSDQDFHTGAANSPESAAWNVNNVSGGNAAAFDSLVAQMSNTVAGRASNASRRYATGQAGFPPGKMNLYGLAQCTPDLTPAQCRGCLAGIITKMPRLFTNRIGGRVLGVRCSYRYEVNAFLHGPVMVRLAAPASSGAPAPAVGPTVLTPAAAAGGGESKRAFSFLAN